MRVEPFRYIKDFDYSKGWDAYAEEYAALPKSGGVYLLTKTLMHRIVQKYMGKSQNHHVLDFNCGTGNDFPYFLENNWKVTGVDGSRGMLNKAHENFEDSIKAGRLSLYEILTENMHQNMFEANSFDLIFSVTGGFSYLTDEQLLRTNRMLSNWLKPNGVLVVANLNRFCISEALYFLAKRNRKRGLQRFSQKTEVNILGESYTMYLRSVYKLKSLYTRSFEIVKMHPLLAFTPPYQTGHKPSSGSLMKYEKLESCVLDFSPLSVIADQVVTVARKKGHG